MILNTGAKTDVGRVRKNNEDSYFVDDKSGILVVADGMGGHASGEIASRLAVDIIRDYFDGLKEGREPVVGDYDDSFSKTTNQLAIAIRLANMAIYDAAVAQPQYRGMGTTIVAVIIKDNRLSIAHVGDSRIYLIRAGALEQLTDDHSIIAEQLKKDLITKEEAAVSEMKNVLTRAVGSMQMVDVDLSELTLSGNDVLLLCSDGLHSMVCDEDILTVAKLIGDPQAVCEKLVDMANENGGKDNVTVVMAQLKKKKWYSILLKIFGR